MCLVNRVPEVWSGTENITREVTHATRPRKTKLILLTALEREEKEELAAAEET